MRLPRFLLLLNFIALGVTTPVRAAADDPDYHAQGNPITATWSVDRRELTEKETLLATLTIHGATNPLDIVRPDLRTIKAFTEQFRLIENVAHTTAPAVTFTYRLQPRDQKTNRLPSLDFPYARPGESRASQSARVKGIDLVVAAALPTPEAKRPPVPLTEPEALFAITMGPRVLRAESFAPHLLDWLALLAFGPLLALTWFALWRYRYPDAARQAHQRRSRAGRRALDAIRRSPTAGVAVLHYLRERFQIPEEAVTPSEIARDLQRVGVPDAEVNAAEEFFRHCDAARFAPASERAQPLCEEATALIVRLEACA